MTELIFKQIIQALISSLITAIFLRAGMKWVAKQDHVPYGQAYLTMLLSSLLSGFIGGAIGFTVGMATGSMQAVELAALLSLPVAFLATAFLIASRHNLPFGRACGVTGVIMALGLAVALIILIPTFIILSLS